MLAEYLGARVAVVDVSHPIEVIVRPAGDWLRAVEAGFISTLQLLPDDERSAGIAAIRAAYPEPGGHLSYQLRFTRIVGS
ncbi:MAG: hypothetical protein GY704_04550 [Phycisphaeraceae bacterium]|nr:hypothetical protein [Phycisphaeraceae bacterium]